jgi:hypothetical protein
MENKFNFNNKIIKMRNSENGYFGKENKKLLDKINAIHI